MADNTDTGGSTELSFKVKTSGDGLHSITIPETSTVMDLKTKLSGEEYENISVDRMRLIYSGRVMKNDDPLSTYKIKNGNTVHMVKSAASNPAPASSATPSAPAQPAVPTNMSAGTSANNPLDNLTGARYAGFANLPSADMFGPNGGMGAPPNLEEMADLFQNPQVAQAMNEAMDNPAFIDMMIQNNPMLRNMPNAREVLQSQMPMIRQFMTNPDAMRNMMRMRSLFEGAGGQAGGFPAPGSANPNDQSSAGSGGQQAPLDPFAFPPSMFGANPFLNPFGAQPPPYARSAASPAGATAPSTTGATPAAGAAAGGTGSTATGTNTDSSQTGSGNNASQPPQNPFAALFGGAGADPQALAELLRGSGLGGMGGGFGAAAPPDNRPPEERYADQLRQLNDMGFTDFDANVRALRRSGGSVQGAIEHLLG